MADNDCTDGQRNDCEDDTFPQWLTGIIIVYVGGVCGIGVVVSIMTIIGEYGRWSESRNTSRTCTRNVLVKIPLGFLVALMWPFLLAFTVFCRNPRRVYNLIARRVRRRQQGEQAIDVRQRVKIWTPGKWEHRGWIVMMRARHRRSLLRATKSWLPWSNFRRPKQRQLTASAAVSSTFDPASGTPALSEIELVEAGRSDQSFARVVTAVVEIEEEGLFRSIVTYI